MRCETCRPSSSASSSSWATPASLPDLSARPLSQLVPAPSATSFAASAVPAPQAETNGRSAVRERPVEEEVLAPSEMLAGKLAAELAAWMAGETSLVGAGPMKGQFRCRRWNYLRPVCPRTASQNRRRWRAFPSHSPRARRPVRKALTPRSSSAR